MNLQQKSELHSQIPPPWTHRALIALGTPLTRAARELRSIARLTRETLAAIVTGKVARREVIAQAFEIGNRSALFVFVTLGVLGFISVYQVAYQIAQILPDYTMLGPAFIHMMVREFAPTMTGLMVATRVGSGIAAELGSMVVTEQVDALRMSNADPVRVLVAPRTLAAAVMMVALSVLGVIAASLAGMLIANAGYGVAFATFWRFDLVTLSDVAIGVVKALAYGLAIPILAGHAGLSARGGSAGVGWATTQAVVHTSFAVIVLDFIVTGVAFILIGR